MDKVFFREKTKFQSTVYETLFFAKDAEREGFGSSFRYASPHRCNSVKVEFKYSISFLTSRFVKGNV